MPLINHVYSSGGRPVAMGEISFTSYSDTLTVTGLPFRPVIVYAINHGKGYDDVQAANHYDEELQGYVMIGANGSVWASKTYSPGSYYTMKFEDAYTITNKGFTMNKMGNYNYTGDKFRFRGNWHWVALGAES